MRKVCKLVQKEKQILEHMQIFPVIFSASRETSAEICFFFGGGGGREGVLYDFLGRRSLSDPGGMSLACFDSFYS